MLLDPGWAPWVYLNNNFEMTLKKGIKSAIVLFIEADADPVKIVIRASKFQILKLLDQILPDDPGDTKPSK